MFVVYKKKLYILIQAMKSS